MATDGLSGSLKIVIIVYNQRVVLLPAMYFIMQIYSYPGDTQMSLKLTVKWIMSTYLINKPNDYGQDSQY